MRRKNIALLIVLIYADGMTLVGLLEYDSINKLTYSIQDVTVDGFQTHPITASVDINMRIYVNFKTGGVLPVQIDSGTYHVDLDSISFGDGQFNQIYATNAGSVTTFTLNATLYANNALEYAAFVSDYLAGNNIISDVIQIIQDDQS